MFLILSKFLAFIFEDIMHLIISKAYLFPLISNIFPFLFSFFCKVFYLPFFFYFNPFSFEFFPRNFISKLLKIVACDNGDAATQLIYKLKDTLWHKCSRRHFFWYKRLLRIAAIRGKNIVHDNTITVSPLM